MRATTGWRSSPERSTQLVTDFLDLPPLRRAEGTIRLPGSKSITIRTLLLAGLARGQTRLQGVLDSDDSSVMLDALRALGVQWQKIDKEVYVVDGGAGPFPEKRAALFVGNSGASARSLVAALAMSGGHYDVDGVPRMRERPIRDLVDALRGAGADIEYTGADGCFPLRIAPGNIIVGQPLHIRGDVSSQFLTGLLQALPLTGKTVSIEVAGELISKPYIEITLNLMARFGVTVARSGWSAFQIGGGQRYSSPGTLAVEGDASGASYFLAAGAIGGGGLAGGGSSGGRVRVEGVGAHSIQGDVRFADALEQMVRRSGAANNGWKRMPARCMESMSIAWRFPTPR